MLYRIDVMGFEDNNMAPYHYCVHGNASNMELELRFFDNVICGYNEEEVMVIMEWVGSLKWLTVKEIRLIPFSS